MYASFLACDLSTPQTPIQGRIKRTKPFYVDEFKALKKLVAPEVSASLFLQQFMIPMNHIVVKEVKNIKINMCAPAWWHHRHGSDLSYDLNVYKNDTEFFDDLGAAYQAEFQELYELGCRYIQIDDPTFAFFCYEPTTAGMKEAGVDPEALLDTYVHSINACTKNRPSDLNVAVHICRGNYRGIHFCEGSYEPIAEKVFKGLDVDTLFLEFDDERSGGFDPLKHVPSNKTVVLGLVTTKKPNLESIDDLKSRVYKAAAAMENPLRSKEAALNQLCISPQCGFASTWHGNPITEEDEKKKLRLVVETAKQLWQDSE
jgi:methionine synthase II (cobalamin-independent)